MATRPQAPPAPPVPSGATPPAKSGHSTAVVAGFLGWALDAFDYFLVVFCLTAIAKDFNKSDADIALSITITLAFRPVGAFVFGLLADRYGRRIPLMMNLVFYSIVEVATAFTHSYASFMLLRALFGIGMGGEWGLGASLAMEKVPARLRGLISGLLQQGYAFGNLLAAVAYFTLFDRWGWRPLFILGGLPALLALFVFAKVEESEVWKTSKQESWGHLGRAIVSNWRVFIYITILMTTMNLSSHGTQDMFPTFLRRQWGLATGQVSMIGGFSMIGAMIGGLLVGMYSDRIGRRRAMITSLILAVCVVPLWAYAPSIALLYVGAFLMQFMVQGAWGVIPAHLAELSPDSVRGFLPGFGYQCGVLLASSVAWLEAVFAEHTSYANAMALTAATVFILACIATASGKEKRGSMFAGGS